MLQVVSPRNEEPVEAVDSVAEVARRFRLAWTAPDDPATAAAELFPQRLARASAEILDVDGAGLSAHNAHFRVPLGASDEAASLAERLQFTQGEGPCLHAVQQSRPLVADPDTLDTRWPAFTSELRRHTPFRAVISLPVKTYDFVGALDLYLVDPSRLRTVSVTDAITVTHEIGSALNVIEAMDWRDGSDGIGEPARSWLRTPGARSRTLVWVAAGMVMIGQHLDAGDAVAALRAYAYGHDRLVDDVARGLVDGDLDVDDLAP